MSDRRMRVWFALFVLAVFGVGLATGILIGRRMIGPPFEGPGGPFGMGRGRGPGAAVGLRPGALLQRLTDELQLTPDQQAQVKEVLATRRARLEQLQRDVRDRFEREQQSLRDGIRKVLTPEQQDRFEQWIAGAPPPRGRGPRRNQ